MYSLTFCTKNRKKIFINPEAVKIVQTELEKVSNNKRWNIEVYCFMPDHLHILVSPQQDEVDLISFVSLFKQKSGFLYKQKTGQYLWQKSYHDHALRSDEDLFDVARYILENPQRAKIVDNWREYPFLGSFIHNIDDL